MDFFRLAGSSIFSEVCSHCVLASVYLAVLMILRAGRCIYRWESFYGVCESVKTIVTDTSPLLNIHLPTPLSCRMSQRWKESRPPPPPHSPCPARVDSTWLKMCPPCPAAGGVCFTGLCNAGPGGVRFHRYKSFRFNPITQEWVVRAQGFCIIPGLSILVSRETGSMRRGRDYCPPLILFNQCLHSKRREGSLNSNSAIPHLSAHRRRLVIDIVKYLLWQLLNSLMFIFELM